MLARAANCDTVSPFFSLIVRSILIPTLLSTLTPLLPLNEPARVRSRALSPYCLHRMFASHPHEPLPSPITSPQNLFPATSMQLLCRAILTSGNNLYSR